MVDAVHEQAHREQAEAELIDAELIDAELIDAMSRIEDERGVDIAQIQELLAMTPAERLARMVDVVHRMRAMTDHAQQGRG